METLCVKLEVANQSNHRLLKRQRKGMDQQRKKDAGLELKRERVTFSDKLAIPLGEVVSGNDTRYFMDEIEAE